MKGTKWAIGLVMLVFGFLITTQYRVTQEAANKPTDLRAEELSKELNATRDKLQATERDNQNLKAELDKLTKAGTGASVVTKNDPNLELLAGTTEAKGQGVLITLTQAPETTNKTRIRDLDLWTITQELRAAGAEGIAINNQRITAISAIRDVGQRTMINSVYTTAPYTIVATGNPAVLNQALMMPGGVVEQFKAWNMKVTIVQSKDVTLPGFGSVPDFRYTQPK